MLLRGPRYWIIKDTEIFQTATSPSLEDHRWRSWLGERRMGPPPYRGMDSISPYDKKKQKKIKRINLRKISQPLLQMLLRGLLLQALEGRRCCGQWGAPHCCSRGPPTAAPGAPKPPNRRAQQAAFLSYQKNITQFPPPTFLDASAAAVAAVSLTAPTTTINNQGAPLGPRWGPVPQALPAAAETAKP